jgi:hypothetical protein
MSEIDELVQRAVRTVTMIAGKAARFSGRILVVVTLVCVAGFLLGIAALSGGIETVWIVLGIVFGATAIGSAFRARWRVGSVRRHAPELADELRGLLSQERDSTRTVVETFVVESDGEADGAGDSSAIVLSRQVGGFRNAMGPGLATSPRMSEAVTAITSFPFLLLAAVLISAVFAFLGVIFLIALAL